MSYNIDSVQYVSGSLAMRCGDVVELMARCRDELPESCFLRDLVEDVDIDDPAGPDALQQIRSPNWQGECSGNGYELLRTQILPKTIGTATLLFIWEGGDSQSGLRVVDGVVTEGKVKVVIE